MTASAFQVSPEAGALLRVSASGPFSVAGLVWRDAQGRLTATVVAKATYELGPGESAPIEPAHSIQEQDSHWDDDPSRSVHVPSDLVPFKHAAEVVVVGSAFAPAPVASLVARVLVGSVDKSIELFPPRHFRQDGALSPSAPLRRFSLRYERAAGGGPGSDNPPGVDVSRADGLGRRPAPQILPAFFTLTSPDEHIPTAGFGPVAPTWPLRAASLGPNDRAWLRQPARARLPPSFAARFFQSAPPDQWLDRALAANERVVLEGLHPEVGRLVMSLSGLEPRAIVAGGAQAIRLVADMLFIDTDQSICTLTYRAQIPLAEGAAPLRIVVAGVQPGHDLSPEDAHRLLEIDGDDIETTRTEGIALGPPDAGSTGRVGGWSDRPVLPFAYEPSARAPQASSPDGALPFRAPDAVPPPRPSQVLAPPAPRATPVPPPAPPPPPPVPVVPVVPSLPSLAAPVPTPPLKPTKPAPASFDAAFGGAKAASDAAARTAPAEPPPAKREGFGPPPAPADAAKAPAGDADGRRQAVVSLLCFEARILPRVRSARRFAAALAPRARPRRAPGIDEPRREEPPDDRADVLRVLSCGRPVDAAEIHRALADSLDDLDDLDPPLVLVAGELRPTFDEIEVLRATAAVAQQVASGDKKVLSAIAVGQEALAAPVAPRPETTLGLVRQIEQASASLSLPARYVAVEVERLLVEGRKYKRRPLLGAPRVRADLTLSRGGEVMPIYLPDAAAASLPLLLTFPVVALCEVAPREDLSEALDEALFAQALGRVLRSR